MAGDSRRAKVISSPEFWDKIPCESKGRISVPISSHLFNAGYPGPQVKEYKFKEQYVGDVITRESLDKRIIKGHNITSDSDRTAATSQADDIVEQATAPQSAEDEQPKHDEYIEDQIFETWTPPYMTSYIASYVKSYTKSFDGWPNYPVPILISAQMGRGKNYFVTHTLREYAKTHNTKILYVCNRVALNEQQKRELAKAIGCSFFKDIETFDNVTVITYQRLQHYFQGNVDESFYEQFQYVVLDECHYFYSDAMFNASTGDTLRLIPQKFIHSYRIYMTATPEPVISPIYSAELSAILEEEDALIDSLPDGVENDNIQSTRKECSATRQWPSGDFFGLQYLPRLKVYTFNRDYSAYKNVFFFTRSDTNRETDAASNKTINSPHKGILKVILEEKQHLEDKLQKHNAKENGSIFADNKWVIFVSKKDYGHNLAEDLRNNGISAYCFDSNSGESDDIEEEIRWKRILRNGTLDDDVLIATSVLDNGFSIKDDTVKNIVLFTNDRTEFLQELGRIRLKEGQTINVYIAKTTLQYELSPSDNSAWKEVLELYYGSEASSSQSNKAVSVIKKVLYDKHREYKFITIIDTAHTEFQATVKVNFMAYYHTLWIDSEINQYKALCGDKNNDRDKASILYKLRWLAEEPSSIDFDNMQYEDADIAPKERAIALLEKSLREYAGKKMKVVSGNAEATSEEEECFNSFSSIVRDHYIAVTGDKKNIGRKMGIRAISNKLNSLFEKLNMKEIYSLQKEGSYYVLRPSQQCADSAPSEGEN